MTGKEHELSSRRGVNTIYSMHRSKSDGYLSQMEKQKQLRTTVTYKVSMSEHYLCSERRDSDWSKFCLKLALMVTNVAQQCYFHFNAT